MLFDVSAGGLKQSLKTFSDRPCMQDAEMADREGNTETTDTNTQNMKKILMSNVTASRLA